MDAENRVCAALYAGLQHGLNARTMTARYLPDLREGAGEISDILRKTTGVPG
jgi:hypothetical protein